MGVYICDRCLHEHVEPTRCCVRCGRHGVWYRPTAEDIRSQCEEIRSTWSETREAAARRWTITAEVSVEVRTRPRGRRVMRECNPD
jgi:hypothetical protein